MKTLTTFLFVLALTLTAFAPRLRGQITPVVTTLYSFTGSGADGENPDASLVQGSDGNFYGTTLNGGSNGVGTVFQITPSGMPATLHNFAEAGTDASHPQAGLVQGSDGNFYGTTAGGGSRPNGTVFEITPAGGFTTLHSFTNIGADGTGPQAGLIQGSDGNFYGTTSGGGDSGIRGGTVFQITPAGVLTTLHSFTEDGTDGADPQAGLVQGSDGNFYGTTAIGGGSSGAGTVFQMTPAGVLTTLYSFTGSGTDGTNPEANLIQGSDGNFYGTTANGGSSGDGTIFRITAAGVLTTLYSFTGLGADGADPQAGLVQGSDGNFYGTTARGGIDGDGTVFRFTSAGTNTTLHSFTGTGADGSAPKASLIQGSDGNFYGTAEGPGGTVFRLSLTPPVGTLQFAAASYGTTDNAGSVTLTVSRTGGSAGAVSVDYSETDGTAFAGLDYQVMGGTLTWADGDATDNTITVPINDRSIDTGATVSFSVGLTNPTGGATLGTIPTATVNILDGDAPQPVITLTSPPNNLTSVSETPVPIAAGVADPGGILHAVQFFVNGTLVYTNTGAGPYVYNSFAPEITGPYTIEAEATDTQGRISTSSVTVNITPLNASAPPPTTSLLTPADGRNLAAGSTLTLSATAAATGLQQVSFYADGVVIASFDGNGNPLSNAAGPSRPTRRDAPGVGQVFQTIYTLPGVDKIINLIAVAIDQLGVSTVSQVVSVHSTVTTDLAPLVALGGLADGAHLAVGSVNAITVAATDPDAGTPTHNATAGGLRPQDLPTNAIIAKLEFFINGIASGVSTTPPFGFTFTPPSSGTFVLNAVATDGSGLATVSDPVVVEADSAAPTVNLAVGGSGVAVEGGAKGIAVVTRTGDTSAALTVSYKAKGSAKAGVDYKTLSGTVIIPAGATKAKIKVKPIDGSPNAGTLKIKLVLLAPADGSYTVGTSPIKIKLIGK